MANPEPGAGTPAASRYLCHPTCSTRLQTTEALFQELDHGNFSDRDGEFDILDDEDLRPCAFDEAQTESDSESSDGESALHISGGWRRKSFKAPDFSSTTILRPCHCSVTCCVKKVFLAGTAEADFMATSVVEKAFTYHFVHPLKLYESACFHRRWNNWTTDPDSGSDGLVPNENKGGGEQRPEQHRAQSGHDDGDVIVAKWTSILNHIPDIHKGLM
ncbi:uncharacterized protein LOC144129622 [Amblyomma americanum]